MSVVSSQNYYEILGVSKTATDSEIRVAYKNAALKYHPDRAAKNDLTVEKATAAFKLIGEAYETLSQPQKRKMYDIINDHVSVSASASSHSTNEGFDFHSFNFRDFAHRHKNEDEVIYPDKIDQDATHIIDSDNSDLLDQYLKSKSFESSFLKTMLYEACKKGKLNVVKYFIEVRKLNVNLMVNDGVSFAGPIFKAAAESGNLELVKYLLEIHHADIESQGLSEGTKDTALSRAALKGHEGVVEYLISKGAKLNPKVSYSDILNIAISSKKLSVVMLLVEAGTKIGDYNLGRALEKGTLDIVQYLLQKRPGIKSHHYTFPPACLAVKSGNVALVKYLIVQENLNLFEKMRSQDDSIDLLLDAAAASGSIEMMRFLVEEKKLGETLLANEKYIEAVLSYALYSVRSTEGQKQERLKFVQFLMEEKKLTLPKDKLKKLIADKAEYAGIEMNSYLQSYLSESDDIKNTLKIIASQGLKAFNLADLLKFYNSKLIKQGNYGDFSHEVHCHIEKRKVSIEQLRELFTVNKEIMNEALFYYSSYYFNGDLSPLQLLFELGVDLNAENGEGIAAIHLALHSGGVNNIVQFYVNNKADLSKKNKFGQTAAEILKRANKNN